MKRFIYIVGFLLFGCCAFAQQPQFLLEGRGQGTSYKISYYHPTQVVDKSAIDSVLEIIDLSMSTYRKESLISQFNDPSTNSIQLDSWMLDVMKRSFTLHKESKGIFDVTVKPLVSLWGFGPERIKRLPSATEIDAALALVGMNKLRLKGRKLSKLVPGVSIDLNGIAQGYTVDVLAAYLDRQQIDSYIVELGGEIKTKGVKNNAETYKVAIERPEGADEASFVLSLTNRAVTTSGNYRQSFDFEGRKIHHHINPFDGYPLQNNIASVTVIAATAMDADAYDNVFMALPVAEGIALANQLKTLELYIIYKEGDTYKEAFSKGFQQYIQK